MSDTAIAVLKDAAVRPALQLARQDSDPGAWGGHEEGGFVVRKASGELTVTRWPKGDQNRIRLPAHPGCQISGDCGR